MPYCAYCGSFTPEISYKPCPSCGNPLNGAPRTAIASGGGTNAAAVAIAVVLGGLAIVAFIGILAAIAIPNLLTAQHHSRQKRTMADLRTIAVGLEAYAMDHNGRYPESRNVADMSAELQPTYVRNLPILDGWGIGMEYECVMKQSPCDSYRLASAGKDHEFEHESLAEYQPGTTEDFDCDIVLADGKFVQYPKMSVPGGEE